MFLSWLDQMTAILDKPMAASVYHIVENIAAEYPQAFVYPFKLSSESFTFNGNAAKQKKEFVEKYKNLEKI